MSTGERGTIREIILVVEYPDGRTKVARVDPTSVARLVFDPSECERLITPEVWRTPNWRDNPAYVVVRRDGSVVGTCRPVDHPPVPGDRLDDPAGEARPSAAHAAADEVRVS